jgi:hypothetical protein
LKTPVLKKNPVCGEVPGKDNGWEVDPKRHGED